MAEVGNVTIKLKLDRSELDKELKGLKNIKGLPPLPVKFAIDRQSLEKELKTIKPVELQAQIKFTDASIKKEVGRLHKEIQKLPIQAPVTIKVRYEEEDRGFFQRIASEIRGEIANRIYSSISNAIVNAFLGGSGSDKAIQELAKKLEEAIPKAVEEGLKKAKVGRLGNNPLEIAFNSLIQSSFSQIGVGVGTKVGKGLVKGLETGSGVNIQKISTDIGAKLGRGINRGVNETLRLQELAQLQALLADIFNTQEAQANTGKLKDSINELVEAITKLQGIKPGQINEVISAGYFIPSVVIYLFLF